MAKVCQLCGKSTLSGRRIQHHHSIGWKYKAPKTTRTFKPNLRKIKADIDGDIKSITVCMKCYKRLRKEAQE
ncbi:50S ribosomal protein L28 [Candidatus Dojkabacteria bacterium]|uniref:Large ribosomal subunit protein bL28 n=1 Tax=Candidatus Dojkabacteria bacterium TaxID=2099670 RepID=A0A847VDI9_9BACT|nr:50S ribosomal protein L28 [Candidatus Dojkabacteria bacterium]